MTKLPDEHNLPDLIEEYLTQFSRRIRPRYARTDVLAELRSHFTDTLADAPQDKDPTELARELITEFGNAKLLSRLIKRAKKRCRPLWAKCVIRTCQIVLVLLLVFAGYT